MHDILGAWNSLQGLDTQKKKKKKKRKDYQGSQYCYFILTSPFPALAKFVPWISVSPAPKTNSWKIANKYVTGKWGKIYKYDLHRINSLPFDGK